jgi:hypothetical protein
VSELVIELLEPVVPNVPLQVSVKDAVGLSGAKRSSARQFTYKPPPPPKDTTKADPTGKSTTAKDSTTKAKTPTAPDTLSKKRP